MTDTQILPLGSENAPADWTLPKGATVTPKSIFAHFNGTAAAGSFIPTLTIFSDSGDTVANIKQDETITAGSAVDATWAPFLKGPAAASSGGTTLNALRLWTSNMSLTIGTANDGRCSYDHVSSFDSTVFGTTSSGGRIIRVVYKKAGWYATFGQVVFTTTLPSGTINMHLLYVGDTLSGATNGVGASDVGLHVGPYPSISVTRYFPDEFDALNGVTELWVAQNSGSSRTINQSNWMHVYMGAGDF